MIDQVNSEPTIGHVVGTSIQNVVFSLKKKAYMRKCKHYPQNSQLKIDYFCASLYSLLEEILNFQLLPMIFNIFYQTFSGVSPIKTKWFAVCEKGMTKGEYRVDLKWWALSAAFL